MFSIKTFRVVRQGCSLSPHPFVICIELLAISIRNGSFLKGIFIIDTDVNREVKFSLYADDTTLLLPGNEIALTRTLQIFDKFSQLSNLLSPSDVRRNIRACKVDALEIPPN